MKIKYAMILAAGFGKRMRPLTSDTPKPLLKIGGQTMLHRILNQLESSSFSNIYISVPVLSGARMMAPMPSLMPPPMPGMI